MSIIAELLCGVSRLLGGDFVGGEMTVHRVPRSPHLALSISPLFFECPPRRLSLKGGVGRETYDQRHSPKYARLLLFRNVPTKISTVFHSISRTDLWSQGNSAQSEGIILIFII